mmetsp:Transcript_63282/g.187083  ORF Transcript_63282/g.187083 Transcript_63282/m.187083 type:complete len:229 (-) Transcript_63282:497-1183(-)|eukprot:CAMPEP_0113571566 /NCGR_PEP_ID=MMETSP0015_2-20120614/25622_1 /TAXON_ID=2838 /ORGANISM="Odontella" /LENGTH=228 /DNA_ID=CAMNT_0000474525 /DNA_START=105 /DNA_END=791 /DNA_ORIENTATION=- /assembly_acc=CAM_ASM_000160
MSSLERRIAELESSLGLGESNPSPRDIHSRIDLLQSGMVRGGGGPCLTSDSLAREIDACKRLARDLEPGSLLTHQPVAPSSSSSSAATSAAPLLYRRQEVLASRDRMEHDLERLGRLRDLLLVASSSTGMPGGPSEGSSGRKISAAADDGGRRFVDAPLLSSDIYAHACDPEASLRLGRVSSRVVDIQGRAARAATRVDDLLLRYRTIMSAVSEKLVMADEDLAALGC